MEFLVYFNGEKIEILKQKYFYIEYDKDRTVLRHYRKKHDNGTFDNGILDPIHHNNNDSINMI